MSASVGADRSDALTKCFRVLEERGFVVVPREVVGLAEAEATAVHAAQLRELDLACSGWRRDPAMLKSKLANGFLGLQMLPEMLELEFDPRVESLFRAVFAHLAGAPHTDPIWVYLERSNMSLGGAARLAAEQSGALPHIDANPWVEVNRDMPYDVERWEDRAHKQKGDHLARPVNKDRPVQAFIALTDCAGGADAGGMGCCEDRDFFEYLKTTPPHGRNGRWGALTRVYPEPGDAKLRTLSKDARQAIWARHKKALGKLVYPQYRAGDVVMWLRETMHAGPRSNLTDIHQARMYLGGLPDCVLNRDTVRRQYESLCAGQQFHGRARDRREVSGFSAFLKPGWLARLGVDPPDSARPAKLRRVDSEDTRRDARFKDGGSLIAVHGPVVSLSQKRPCFIGTLREDLVGTCLTAGCEVFVKIGESFTDAEFQVACAEMRGNLGLESVPATVGTAEAPLSWVCVNRKGEDMIAKLAGGRQPLIVMGAFKGASGTTSKPRICGRQLLHILFFRKFVGAKDTNLANVMVSDDGGAVLSVDEIPHSAEGLRRLATATLVTAQRLDNEVLARVRDTLAAEPKNVARFIEQLRSSAADLDGRIVGSADRRAALLQVQSRCPFDDATLRVLQHGTGAEIQQLARRLTR